MRNPYEILGVSQDANNRQILKAMTMAMRKKSILIQTLPKPELN